LYLIDLQQVRYCVLFSILFITLNAGTPSPAGALWNDLKAKRESLPSVHQEFEVTHISNTVRDTRSSKHQIILDMSPGHWRERSVGGSGNRIRIFDGQSIFWIEEGGDEFVRLKRHSKNEEPAPVPYSAVDVDWSKGVVRERRPCGLPGKDHVCVLLEAPLQRWIRNISPTNNSALVDGVASIVLDTESGLLTSLHTVQAIETHRIGYKADTRYVLRRASYGTPPDESLFKLPGEIREVKEFPRWDAARIKKRLAGKPAPELAVTDIQGKSVTLASFKGKTVLLDFWTTWCPPCRADAPALDKLYKKYSERDLMIIGISVSEDRALVEKFLKEHPHNFPIVLTAENEMPRPYQIGVFPTYIVIDRDGTLASVVQGDQGFGELRKLLKKAGLELE
jgi:thiol-disulfide isomerase/thioredoxin